jgi:hypothetical protein
MWLGNIRAHRKRLLERPSKFHFMGLMHGHWKLPLEDKLADIYGVNLSQLNVGIAAVVPAKKIRQALFDPRLIEMRKLGDRRLRNAPTPDAGAVPKPTQKTRDNLDIPIPTRREVEEVFKKATRKRGKK